MLWASVRLHLMRASNEIAQKQRAALAEGQVLVAPPPATLVRADLFYCLAQAFLPPPAHWRLSDWADPLLDDLRELTVQCGEVRAPRAVAKLQEAVSAVEPTDPWLVAYSQLFLVPPVRVTLNAGVYLEGALGGSSVQMIRSCYEAAGVEPDERFRDLPDHVAMQFEFLARLNERAARGDPDAEAMAQEFAQSFVHGWAGPLELACMNASSTHPSAEVFAALTRLARIVAADPTLS